MAVLIFDNAKLYVGGYDLSTDFSRHSLTYEAEILDNTVFGDSGRGKIAGLTNVSSDHDGFAQTDSSATPVLVEDVLAPLVGGATDQVITLAPDGATAGSLAKFYKAIFAKYAPGAQVGELLAFNLTAEGQEGLKSGTIMVNTALTSTGTGTARQLGAATATQKLYAVMHILAVSGTDPTLDMVVQSDNAEGFPSATDQITFTQASAVGAEWGTPVDGPITDDWWRLSYTIGGSDDPSFTVVVVVGIQ